MARVKVDQGAALRRLMDLLRVPGVSRQEARISGVVEEMLRGLGVKRSWMRRDRAHKAFGGEVGNLIVKIPGIGGLRRAPRRFFSAHVDTVPVCAGAEPVVRGAHVRPRGKTALGADDRAGVAAILAALAEVKAGGAVHCPMTLVFTVCEELGIWGAQKLDKAVLRECAMGFNIDGGNIQTVTVAAPSGYLLDIDITGIASHAGGAPEAGASAATVFALATAELANGGWLGKVLKGRQEGRMNFGVVRGGEATNVTMPEMIVRGECRSHSEAFLDRMATTAKRAFEKAAAKVVNAHGKSASVRFKARRNYSAFKLPKTAAVLAEYRRAVATVTPKPVDARVAYGVVDANAFNLGRLPTVTFGAGGTGAHCIGESCYLPDYYKAVAVVRELMTSQ